MAHIRVHQPGRTMPVSLYLDVHVDKAIHDQLRLRGVDVVRAQDDGAATKIDEDLLQRATDLGRLIFTQDIRFKALAQDWQRQGDKLCQIAKNNGHSEICRLFEGDESSTRRRPPHARDQSNQNG